MDGYWSPPRSGRRRASTFTDRDYFQHFKNDDDKGIFVGKPVADRTTRIADDFLRQTHQRLQQRISRFDPGWRQGHLFPGHLQFDHVAARPVVSAVARRRNGDPALPGPERPRRRRDTGRSRPGTGWFRKAAARYRSPGYFDHTARLVAVRPLSHYPLVIDVAISETAALAGWRNHALTIGIGTLLVIICSVFLLRALINHTNRLVSSEAALAKEQAKVDVALR